MLFRKNTATTAIENWPRELCVRLQSFSEWQAFYHAHPYINNPAYIEMLADEIRCNGFHCPALQRVVPGDQVVSIGELTRVFA